jgi:hypothetical protein
MTDETIQKYAERGCPKAEDGIHVWVQETEDSEPECELCGAVG